MAPLSIALPPEATRPRGRTELPLARYRFGEAPQLAAQLAEAPRLPAPFLALHRVVPSASGQALTIDGDLFLGVSARQCVGALRAVGRRLPLDIWVALADAVIAGLAPLDPEHGLWRYWAGPRTFGVDVDQQVVLFPGADGAPMWSPEWAVAPQGVLMDWSLPRFEGHNGPRNAIAARGCSVAGMLCWLLEAYPLVGEAGRPGWNRKWTHPQLNAELRAVLTSALFNGIALTELRERVLATTPIPMAKPQRVASVFFGACGAGLVPELASLIANPTHLPRRWQSGGLQVQVDQLLELATAPSACPLDPSVVERDDAPAQARPPIAPTPTLELLVEQHVPGTLLFSTPNQARVPVPGRPSRILVRKATLAAGRPLEPRIALPLDRPPRPGTVLVVTLRHPVQVAAAVEFPATVDDSGYAVLGAPTDPRQLELLLASLDPNAVGTLAAAHRGREPGPRPVGEVELQTHVPVRGVLLGVGLIAASCGFSALASRSQWWLCAAVLTTLLAVPCFRRLVESWPLGNRASAQVFAGAAAAALALGLVSKSLLGVWPTLAWVAFNCWRGDGPPNVWSGQWLASRFDRRAAVRHREPCSLCGRRHVPEAHFVECQYGNCRTRLEVRHSCVCDACFARELRTAPGNSYE